MFLEKKGLSELITNLERILSRHRRSRAMINLQMSDEEVADAKNYLSRVEQRLKEILGHARSEENIVRQMQQDTLAIKGINEAEWNKNEERIQRLEESQQEAFSKMQEVTNFFGRGVARGGYSAGATAIFELISILRNIQELSVQIGDYFGPLIKMLKQKVRFLSKGERELEDHEQALLSWAA